MKIAFVHSHYFIKDPQTNEVYSPGKFSYNTWSRFLEFCDELVVISRMRYLSDTDNKELLSRVSGERITFIGLSNINGISLMLNNYLKVQKEIREVAKTCDGIVARMPSNYSIIAIQTAKKLSVPYAVEMVGDPWDSLWNYGSLKGKMIAPVTSLQNKFFLKNSPFVIYVTKEYLQKKYPSKGITAYASNVELESVGLNELEKGIGGEKKDFHTIGLIGSLSAKYKGIDTALKALKELRKYDDYKLEVVGDGDQSYWEELARTIGVHENVLFKGVLKRGDLFNWLSTIDIYIQPSKTEGLPRALIEAMSVGCPAVASNVGGIPELLDDNYLHRPSDFIELAKKIKSIVNDKQILKSSSKSNIATAKEYKREVVEQKRSDFWKVFFANIT
ncbi:glycosyltransferase [Virgibacillus sp. CBA3643]|uniref:glycosyltransferase n=1 Tax=Virgibacillus sp. CBA3643 TaxID=2942278 RepID=UPI0035A334E0